MTSRAFSCNKSLIRKNLSRFWLLSLGLLVILTLKGLSLFSELSLRLTTANRLEEMIDRLYWEKHVGIELISSILIAALMFSYLHQKRGSSFFGSLPVSRNSLFLSSYLSGLMLYCIPWLLTALITTPVIASVDWGNPVFRNYYFGFLCFRLVLYLVGYTMAVFSMLLCGRVAFGAVIALLLQILVPILELLLTAMLESFLYGISVFSGVDTEFLAPYIFLSERLSYSEAELPWVAMGLYAGASLLLIYPLMLLHRRRKEECVGQTLVFPWLYGILQVILTFLGYIVLSALILTPFALAGTDSTIVVGSIPSILIFVIAFFLVKMLLLRSRKVFRKKNFLQCGLFLLVTVAVIYTFSNDLFHIVRRLPQGEKVQEVCLSLSGNDYSTDNPEAIEDLIRIHSHIIEERDALNKEVSDKSDYDKSQETYFLSLTYTMKNGRTLHRTYQLSFYWNDPESRELWYEVEAFFLEDHRAVDQLHQVEEQTVTVYYDDEIRMSTAEIEAFFRALEKDMEAHLQALPLLHISKDYRTDYVVIETKDGNSYYLDIYRSPAPNTNQFLRDIRSPSTPNK
ncbi:MAG: hypothetical protein IKM59_03185 [Oscillospiraceae bacterium]|nr:hypothetical protein [Oscillospiraceae bacterium]